MNVDHCVNEVLERRVAIAADHVYHPVDSFRFVVSLEVNTCMHSENTTPTSHSPEEIRVGAFVDYLPSYTGVRRSRLSVHLHSTGSAWESGDRRTPAVTSSVG